MTRFVKLTGFQGQIYYVNMDRISMEEVENYMLPGNYAANPAWHGFKAKWTIVREEGVPNRIVVESAEDIIKAAIKK